MEDFIKMLKGVKPDIDFEHETALVDDGLLESLDIISIISEISEVYGVDFSCVQGRTAFEYRQVNDRAASDGSYLRCHPSLPARNTSI